MQPLEGRFPRPGPDFDGASIAGIIVIGGAEDRAGLGPRRARRLNEAAERYTGSGGARRAGIRRLAWFLPAARARCLRNYRPRPRWPDACSRPWAWSGPAHAGVGIAQHPRECHLRRAPAQSAARAALAARHIGRRTCHAQSAVSGRRDSRRGVAGRLSHAAPGQPAELNGRSPDGLRSRRHCARVRRPCHVLPDGQDRRLCPDLSSGAGAGLVFLAHRLRRPWRVPPRCPPWRISARRGAGCRLQPGAGTHVLGVPVSPLLEPPRRAEPFCWRRQRRPEVPTSRCGAGAS